jgi:hypothetical protein
MYQTKLVDKIKTHILCPVTFFFPKIASFLNNEEKYSRAGQATDNNMAHDAQFTLDNYGYKHNSEYVIFIGCPL